jgi:hypothetical protein
MGFLEFVGGLSLVALAIGAIVSMLWLYFDYIGIRNDVKYIKDKMKLQNLYED